MQFSPQS